MQQSQVSHVHCCDKLFKHGRWNVLRPTGANSTSPFSTYCCTPFSPPANPPVIPAASQITPIKTIVRICMPAYKICWQCANMSCRHCMMNVENCRWEVADTQAVNKAVSKKVWKIQGNASRGRWRLRDLRKGPIDSLLGYLPGSSSTCLGPFTAFAGLASALAG